MTDGEVKAVAEALREYVAITPAEARLVAEAAISKLDEMRGDGWRPIESAPHKGVFQVLRSAPLFKGNREVGHETDVTVGFRDSLDERIKTPSMFSAVGERFLSWKPLSPLPNPPTQGTGS